MGIWLRHVDDFRIERNESIENLENGIFPTLSANGLVKKNVSYGSEDAALWVEASENVRVIGNEHLRQPDRPRGHGVEEHPDQEERRARQHRRHRPLLARVGIASAAGRRRRLGGREQQGLQQQHAEHRAVRARCPPSSRRAAASSSWASTASPSGTTTSRTTTSSASPSSTIASRWPARPSTARPIRRPYEVAPDDNQVMSNTLIGNGLNPPPGPFARVRAAT